MVNFIFIPYKFIKICKYENLIQALLQVLLIFFGCSSNYVPVERKTLMKSCIGRNWRKNWKHRNSSSLIGTRFFICQYDSKIIQVCPKIYTIGWFTVPVIETHRISKIGKRSLAYLLSSRILSWSALPRWRVGKTDGNVLAHHYTKLETNCFCQISWTHSLSTPQTEIGMGLGLAWEIWY